MVMFNDVMVVAMHCRSKVFLETMGVSVLGNEGRVFLQGFQHRRDVWRHGHAGPQSNTGADKDSASALPKPPIFCRP